MSGMMHSRPFLLAGSRVHMSQSTYSFGFGHFSSSSFLNSLRLNTLQDSNRWSQSFCHQSPRSHAPAFSLALCQSSSNLVPWVLRLLGQRGVDQDDCGLWVRDWSSFHSPRVFGQRRPYALAFLLLVLTERNAASEHEITDHMYEYEYMKVISNLQFCFPCVRCDGFLCVDRIPCHFRHFHC